MAIIIKTKTDNTQHQQKRQQAGDFSQKLDGDYEVRARNMVCGGGEKDGVYLEF